MQRSGLLIIFIFVFSACSPAPTPAATPDILATTAAISSTLVAAALTAQPSPTLPPTLTPAPTATTQPTETATLEPTSGAALDSVASPTDWLGTFAPGDTAGLPDALLLIVNNTGVNDVIFTLNGITLNRAQPVYYSYKVGKSLVITILQARYTYIIQIPNKRIFTGSFGQMKKDKSTFRIELNKVVITGP
jgi:hypothetical protein